MWITGASELPTTDSLFYLLITPSPLFRKEFTVNNSVDEAKLCITAAGYYHASLNGTRLRKKVLDPAWTDFSKRIYYSEYDVTS
ncbi:MAG: alpha-L-rhamnosidase N-terminal domain-containing protein [Saprospiraceae bacterium]|nr:alpha-L-rhamnosidase N-terminal domain-containing protein [Saprospiraceae bacterium]